MNILLINIVFLNIRKNLNITDYNTRYYSLINKETVTAFAEFYFMSNENNSIINIILF
jgi:hypothetical protein